MALAPDLSARRAALTPLACAFTDHSTNRSWTFAEIDLEASRLAQWMARLPAGSRIGVLAYNRAETFVALFAARKAGMILCPLNWRAPAAELRANMHAVGVSALIHDRFYAPIAHQLSEVLLEMAPKGGFSWDVAPERYQSAVQMDEDDPWYLLLTSGTTGAPKAVIQTSRMAQAVAVNLAQAMEFLPSDNGLCCLPLFHTAGINLFTLPLFQWGAHSHILPRADLEAIAGLLRRAEVSQFFAVPTLWQSLLDHPLSADLGFVRLRGLASGGAPLPLSLLARLREEGAILRNGFGMTESGPTGFLMDKAESARRPCSVGKPQMLTEARLAGVADGQAGEGELLLRGPTVTPGYFQNPTATEAAFTDGWLRTGDVASRDQDGYYTIIDRLKDMYVSGGENVFPAEVERVLSSHPFVAEAAVVGVPDPKWGEVGRAYLRPNKGHLIDPEEVLRWCKGQLSPFKLPKEVHLVEDFPRTPSGKIRKIALKALA